MLHRITKRSEDQEAELLRALVELGSQLQSGLELQFVVETIAGAMAEIFGYRETTVFIRDRERDELRGYAAVGQSPDIEVHVLDMLIPGRVFRDIFQTRFQIGDSFFVDRREYTWSPEVEFYFPSVDPEALEPGELHARDALFVPTYDKTGELTVVLDLCEPAGRYLPTLDAVRSLEVFATHAAAAIENALRYAELTHTARDLAETLSLRHYLLDLSTALLSTLDQEEVLKGIAEKLKTLVDYDTMDVRLFDEQTGELVAAFACDTNAEERLEFRSPVDVGVIGWVVEHNQAQLVNDMANDSRAAQVPGTPVDDARASIIVPLSVRGKVGGVLTIDRFGGAQFDAREFETTQVFANLASIAIQNARTYKEMEQQAINDGLTGIHNHRHFRESLSSTVSRAERYGESFCLLMIDLDHFKVVNDTVGHQQGDEVLRAVAAALRTCSRESDYLARYGGEEFVMILPYTELVEARNMAERICESVRKSDPGVPGLQMSTSIGVASFPESSHDADGVLGAADAALLRAKASGRNRVCMHADEVLAHTLLDGHVVSLGRRFAAHAGLSEDETAALITALAVYELSASSGTVTRIGPGGWRNDPAIAEGVAGELETEPSDTQRRLAYDALLYANERWDGAGYPEGLRGENIPRVARAFAVCRSYVTVADQTSGGLARVRAKAARELDPRLVQRLSALVREEAGEAGTARNQARIA